MVSKVGKGMKKELLDNFLCPKSGKSGLFSKARVSVRVRVRARVSCSSCENGHFHSDPVGVASKIFSRRVGTINRVERRGPAQPVLKIWRTFRADVLRVLVDHARGRLWSQKSKRCVTINAALFALLWVGR